MNRLNLTQGTPEWHAHRRQHFNASDAPAMLGCSPYKTRQQLLHEMHTGLTADVDSATQRRFDDGHRFEALARPLGEKIIGEPLYPIVGAEGRLSASFDGLTMAEDVAFEHKTINDDLRYTPWDEGNGYHLPKHFQVQMEQQLMVSGAERVLFMATKWTPSGELTEERHCWYASDPALRAEILAGWDQFARDLAAYVPVAPVEKVRAEPVEDFPVMAPITMTGDVVVQHQLDAFKVKLKAHIAQLPKEPKTDQEFANLEDSVKRRDALEKALKAERERALRGSPNIAQLLTTIDELLALSRDSRLADNEKVTKQKEAMRLEIRNAAQADFDAHVRCWNDKLGRPLLSPAKGTCKDAAIAQGMHGKKSVKGWQEGAAAAVAEAKVAVNMLAETLQANLASCAELCTGHEALFRDLDSLLFKDREAFRVICGSRIADAKAAEERRLEAERARIRAEEEARARQQAQREQQEREAAQRAEQERQQAAEPAARILSADLTDEHYTRAVQIVRENNRASISLVQLHLAIGYNAAATLLERMEKEGVVTHQDPATGMRGVITPVAGPAVIPMPTRAPAATSGPPTLKLGDIRDRMHPLQIDAAGLEALGFPPAGREGAAKLYHQADLPRILSASIAHLTKARDQLAKAA